MRIPAPARPDHARPSEILHSRFKNSDSGGHIKKVVDKNKKYVLDIAYQKSKKKYFYI